jgi:Flp pilus assembly protein TadD
MQGRLEEAGAAYTRAAELDPTDGGPVQQRGHVNALLGRYAEARADYDAAVANTKGNFRIAFAEYRTFVRLFEGDARGAITELEALYKSIDSSDAEDPDGLRAFILGDMALIASHHRMLDVLDRVEQRQAEVRARRIAAVNTQEFREQEAKPSELEQGFSAAYRGNFAKAEQHAESYRKLREPETGANKLWPYYNLKGTIALLQGRNAEAVALLDQSNPNNIYLTYLKAVAHERAGHKAEAKAEYEKVVRHNFIPAGLALVRREAEAKLKAL